MSFLVCKCEHNGRTEYHLRYPGMTRDEAQSLADRINGGELVGAEYLARVELMRAKINELERTLQNIADDDAIQRIAKAALKGTK